MSQEDDPSAWLDAEFLGLQADPIWADPSDPSHLWLDWGDSGVDRHAWMPSAEGERSAAAAEHLQPLAFAAEGGSPVGSLDLAWLDPALPGSAESGSVLFQREPSAAPAQPQLSLHHEAGLQVDADSGQVSLGRRCTGLSQLRAAAAASAPQPTQGTESWRQLQRRLAGFDTALRGLAPTLMQDLEPVFSEAVKSIAEQAGRLNREHRLPIILHLQAQLLLMSPALSASSVNQLRERCRLAKAGARQGSTAPPTVAEIGRATAELPSERQFQAMTPAAQLGVLRQRMRLLDASTELFGDLPADLLAELPNLFARLIGRGKVLPDRPAREAWFAQVDGLLFGLLPRLDAALAERIGQACGMARTQLRCGPLRERLDCFDPASFGSNSARGKHIDATLAEVRNALADLQPADGSELEALLASALPRMVASLRYIDGEALRYSVFRRIQSLLYRAQPLLSEPTLQALGRRCAEAFVAAASGFDTPLFRPTVSIGEGRLRQAEVGTTAALNFATLNEDAKVQSLRQRMDRIDGLLRLTRTAWTEPEQREVCDALLRLCDRTRLFRTEANRDKFLSRIEGMAFQVAPQLAEELNQHLRRELPLRMAGQGPAG